MAKLVWRRLSQRLGVKKLALCTSNRNKSDETVLIEKNKEVENFTHEEEEEEKEVEEELMKKVGEKRNSCSFMRIKRHRRILSMSSVFLRCFSNDKYDVGYGLTSMDDRSPSFTFIMQSQLSHKTLLNNNCLSVPNELNFEFEEEDNMKRRGSPSLEENTKDLGVQHREKKLSQVKNDPALQQNAENAENKKKQEDDIGEQVTNEISEKNQINKHDSDAYAENAVSEDQEQGNKISEKGQNKKQATEEQQEQVKNEITLNKNQVKKLSKEEIAAKAARIRLGFEEDDGTLEVKAPKMPSGPEPIKEIDLEYINTEDLKPLENFDNELEELWNRIETKDWIETCKVLNTVRILSVHHTEECLKIIVKLLPFVLKAVKSLRSQVSKTAILCCGDLFTQHGDRILNLIDGTGPSRPATSLLCQLLLKVSSKDKQFVVDEVSKVLNNMCNVFSPVLAINKILPYISHKNPKVRGNAAKILSDMVSKMEIKDWNEINMEDILMKTVDLVSDKTPEARESGKKTIKKIYVDFEKRKDIDGTVELVPITREANENKDEKVKESEKDELLPVNVNVDEEVEVEVEVEEKKSRWELFCKGCLNSNSRVLSILKITEQS